MARTARYWLAGMLLLAPALAGAQTTPQPDPRFPQREREPVPSQVQQQDQARGLGQEFTPREDKTVDQIYKELTGQNPTAPTPPPQAPPPRR